MSTAATLLLLLDCYNVIVTCYDKGVVARCQHQIGIHVDIKIMLML